MPQFGSRLIIGLSLGRKGQDILLVTDFEYQYNGVKPFVIEGDIYYHFDLAASKIPVIVYLLSQGILEPRQMARTD